MHYYRKLSNVKCWRTVYSLNESLDKVVYEWLLTVRSKSAVVNTYFNTYVEGKSNFFCKSVRNNWLFSFRWLGDVLKTSISSSRRSATKENHPHLKWLQHGKRLVCHNRYLTMTYKAFIMLMNLDAPWNVFASKNVLVANKVRLE